jgi:Spy/CpxP family protein refolding chaperone
MSVFKIFPWLMTSACVSVVLAPSVLAQSFEAVSAQAGQPPLHLAQATTTTPATTTLENQPDSVDDLAIDSLTDDQVAQITAIFETYQPQIDAATIDYLAALEVMNNLLVPATADLALTDAFNAVVATEAVVDELTFQRNLAIRGVLTPDQRQIINDYVRAYLGIGPATPVAEFPMTLVGLDADTAIADLQADGWVIAFTTPGEVGLNRGSQELNLEISRNGEVLAANLVR